MKFKRSTLTFISFITIILFAFIPKDDDPIKTLVGSLQKWAETNPQEKVYIHMDKPYYALGDTIWFKGYVLIGSHHQLSAMSGALYVDLIDEQDQILVTVKLPITAGMAIGNFTLIDEYKSGNYRIRAYTQWMRNAGDEYFFDHTFPVADPFENKDSEINPNSISESKPLNSSKAENKITSPQILTQSDIQFFPEGGNMITGINSRIAFKAVGTDGLGVNIKGLIKDHTGAEITMFQSSFAGMGNFNLMPERGKSYQAEITFSDGSRKTVSLPKASDKGYVLAVYQTDNDSLLVRINTPVSSDQPGQSVSLVVQSGGETIGASRLSINKPVTSVWMSKKEFPTGIAQFTLFNDLNEPLNERIAFLRNSDQMQLKVSSAKTKYKSREKVELFLDSKDRAGSASIGNFSVSVIDESKVPFDESNESSIMSNILLSSEVKGYIEKPNYYFGNNTEKVNSDLDNLMMTQGYRRFSWKAVVSAGSAKDSIKFKAESFGTEISGRVLSLGGKPVVNGSVTLFSLTPAFMDQVRTDKNGLFKFAPVMLADSIKFSVQAQTEKKSKKVETLLDESPKQAVNKNKNSPNFHKNIRESIITYIENSRLEDQIVQQKGGLGRVQRLNEVVVRGKRIQDNKYTMQGAFKVPDESSDQVYLFDAKDNCSKLAICLQGKLQGITFQPNCGAQNYPFSRNEAMDVFLDGRKMECDEIADIFDNNLIDPIDIGKVLVVRSNQAMINMLGGKPAILIITKKGFVRRTYNPSIAHIRPKGFNKAREFYAPRYDRVGIGSQMPDLRSTIYWNPKVKTNEAGKTQFSFFNADGPGNYKVIIEGVNAAGELGRVVYRYEVERGKMTPTDNILSTKNNNAVRQLQDFQQRLPVEKLYIHTDKPYYNIGDTLWFKAYLLDVGTLSAAKRSGLLYVELNDDTADAVRRISIPLKNGIAYAQIPLPRKIFHEGAYTIRAYTNWMQNFGTDYFFSRRIYLGVPTRNTWLVKASSTIAKVEDKDQLQADFNFTRSDRSPAGLRDVEVTILEDDNKLRKMEVRTSSEGNLSIKHTLKEKLDGRNIRAEIRSLHKNDGNQRLKVPLNIKRAQNIDLQFMPEGGKLVAGIMSTIGFKAVGEDGKGQTVKGEIFDSKGKLVGVFASLYNGMGSFQLRPENGEVYTAKLIEPKETSNTFKLPVVNNSGTVLNLANVEHSDSLRIDISSSPGAINPDSSYSLIATSRGIVTHAQVVDVGNKSFSVAKSKFPTGITRFTLLRNKTPLNQRIVFIEHTDGIQFSINANQNLYKKRDSVIMDIEVKNVMGEPIRGSFSLAVTDDTQVKADTANHYGIKASLLINSDLKGSIENPGYYLNQKHLDRWKALENLMLTQGWTGYSWDDVFTTPKPPIYLAEDHFKVRGTVTNILNKPVPGAQMLISSQKPSFITTTISDDKGVYTFENLPQIDSGSFFIQAKTPKGKKMSFGAVTVDRFQSPIVPENYRDQVLPWYVNSDVEQLNYVKNVAFLNQEGDPVQTGNMLEEVKIVSKKIIKGTRNPYGPGNADLVFDEKDIKESGLMGLYDLLRQKLPGLRIVWYVDRYRLKLNKFFVNISIDGGAKFDVEGRTVEQCIEGLNEFQIATFRGLEVIYSRKHTNKTLMLEAIKNANGAPKTFGADPNEYAEVVLTTFSGAGWHRISKAGVVSYRPLPVMKPQEFYSPKYRMKNSEPGQPDLRSTIYWTPNITTDANGKAKVSFYTSDVSGSYTLNLQGSDMDGNIGSLIWKMKVE